MEAANPTNLTDDPQFLARLQAGEDRAFEDLIRLQGARMLAVAMRLLRNEEESNDCVQEAFLQAFKRIGQFEARSKLSTWLHRIVVNCALMRLRSRQRHPEAALEDLLPQFDATGHRTGREPQSSLPSAEDVLQTAELQDMVQAQISRLPEIYRNVLVLRDIEEYDTDTVAQMLDVQPGVIKTRLHRARAMLKRLIEDAMPLRSE